MKTAPKRSQTRILRVFHIFSSYSTYLHIQTAGKTWSVIRLTSDRNVKKNLQVSIAEMYKSISFLGGESFSKCSTQTKSYPLDTCKPFASQGFRIFSNIICLSHFQKSEDGHEKFRFHTTKRGRERRTKILMELTSSSSILSNRFYRLLANTPTSKQLTISHHKC